MGTVGATGWLCGLLGEPEDEVDLPIGDVASVAETAGADAEVAVVAHGAFGFADQGGCFLQQDGVFDEPYFAPVYESDDETRIGTFRIGGSDAGP